MIQAVMVIITTSVVGVIAYFAGKRSATRPSFRFSIHIRYDPNRGYYSKTTPSSERVRGGDHVHWKIKQEKKLPDGSVVQLRFPDDSCLIGENPDDEGKGSDIQTFVKFGKQRADPYAYRVYYIDASKVDHLLEDPELIVEGN